MPPAAPGTAAGDRPARLAVGIVGAGRVGSALGAALANAGHHIVAASAVSVASRRRAADLLPGAEIVAAHEVARRAGLLLLAVPDDDLGQLVEGLAATGAIQRGQLLAHTSGRHGIAILDPATRAGALPLALHPVMTFTGTGTDVARLAGCSFGITAPEPLRPVAEALVVEMGGEPQWVAEELRPLYHAALAHGANHLVTLVADAMDLLRQAGVDNPGRMLGPLLGAALDGALRSGDAALTGPVSRGDAGTVAAHVHELRRTAPDSVAAYVAMARLTADRALAAGRLRPAAAEALLDVLGDGPRMTTPRVVHTRADLRAALTGCEPGRAVVMTMGALHEGHATLVREARRRARTVVVTIFLNPLQFAPGEDLSRYPKTLRDDLVICAREGVDVVFAPPPAEVYPDGDPLVRIDAGPLGAVLEGASRPGHFDGVLTVVAKLLHLTGADLAYFGQKDAQQLLLIRRMARDLDIPVEIVAVPTVREPDGLALSSRNSYLQPADRRAALALSRALRAGVECAALGAAAVRSAAAAVLAAEPALSVDYLALADPATLAPVADDAGNALLLVAARVGTTRLIDNVPVTLPEQPA